VAKLRERQRQAVVLFDLEDRSHADVAMRLGVTPQAAKSLLYRARAELRAALEPIVQA
jgi:RNA polymerase sigma-70 factor (ECF subfamily)